MSAVYLILSGKVATFSLTPQKGKVFFANFRISKDPLKCLFKQYNELSLEFSIDSLRPSWIFKYTAADLNNKMKR